MIATGRPAPTTAAAAPLQPADPAPASTGPRYIARLVPLEAGFYAFSLAAAAGWQEPALGLVLPSVEVSQPPGAKGAIEIVDDFGGTGSWLGGRHRMLFVSVPAGGATALVTGYPADSPVELEICRIAARDAGFGESRLVTLGTAAGSPSEELGLEILAHIRGRGDVRFVDAPTIGRLGTGAWIEALTLVPRDQSASEAIEYKGLTAGGAETPWTGCGAPCGTRGRGQPLIGLAVRQKAAAADVLFDCEYTGYFQSGATAGPARNGAPCRSSVEGDPLEGLELRITRRPLPPSPPPGRPAASGPRTAPARNVRGGPRGAAVPR